MSYYLFVGDTGYQEERESVHIGRDKMLAFIVHYRAKNHNNPPRHVGSTALWFELEDKFNFKKVNSWDLHFRTESDRTFFLMQF